jgi:predicted DNA-binding transcriptional regulator YafY
MSAVCEAITNRRLLRIDYGAGERLIEPHAHGLSKDGNPLLRAYQVSGASDSGEPTNWKLFRMDRVNSVQATDQHFAGPRPDYNPNDPAMMRVHCRI